MHNGRTQPVLSDDEPAVACTSRALSLVVFISACVRKSLCMRACTVSKRVRARDAPHNAARFPAVTSVRIALAHQLAQRLARLGDAVRLGSLATDEANDAALQDDQALRQGTVRVRGRVGEGVDGNGQVGRRAQLAQLGRQRACGLAALVERRVLLDVVDDRLVEPAVGRVRLLEVDQRKVGACRILALELDEGCQR